MIQLYDFDPFEYSVAILFVIFMLILFIGILWYNTLHRKFTIDNSHNSQSINSKNSKNSNNNVKCIPQPSNLLGDTKFY